MSFKHLASAFIAAAMIAGVTASAEGDKQCVKITAEYENGRCNGVSVETVDRDSVTVPENTAEHKVFYWESLNSMIPVELPDSPESPTAAPETHDYSFRFGSGVSGAAYQVTADTVYGAHDGLMYGIAGVEGAIMNEDARFDGFRVTDDGVTSLLKDNDGSIEIDYSAYSDEIKEKMGDSDIPVRFAMEAERNGYYRVTAEVVNTSDTESTEVSLYSETRHFILFHHTLAPGESITKTFNVHLAPTYVADNGGVREDDAINVCVTGRNAGLVSVDIDKIEDAPTIYTMTDSTGADQLSYTIYWMLENYGGTGQALSKYISPDVALSNQGEGGLDTGDTLHFNNAVKYMKAGDFMYVQYGFNDNKDTSIFKRNLEKYYTACHNVGAYLIVVSPTDRRNTGANWDSANKVWTASNANFAIAGKEFVEAKLTAGAEDIAFVDVNTPFVEWMNLEEQNILKRRKAAGFDDTAVNARAMEYYYRCGWTFGTDSVHINDAGADRAAYIFAQAAREIIAADPSGAQARVLSQLMDGAAEETPVELSDSVIRGGWAPNGCYPKPLSDTVELQYPTMVKSVDNSGDRLNSMTVKLQSTSINKYAQGVGELLDADGNVIRTIYTRSTSQLANAGHIDATSLSYGAMITMYFDPSENELPTGGSYRVYLLPIDNGADMPDAEPLYSSVYTEPAAQTAALLDTEMFDYAIDDGESLNGKGGWSYLGSASSVLRSKETHDGYAAAHLYTNGTGTYAFTRFLSKSVSAGLIHTHLQINHEYGWYGIALDCADKARTYTSGVKIIAVEDGMVKLCDGISSAGMLKPGEWTDVDVWLDLDRCTETVSVGGDKVSCDVTKLMTSDKSKLSGILPIKTFTVIYTQYPSLSPSYAFDTYLTDITVESLETSAPQVTVSAYTESGMEEMGSVIGAGSYDINSDVTLTAVPETGYNFIGWYRGGEVYSKNAQLTIERIREDISLTARFAVKRGKEQTASFGIAVDKSAVKAGGSISLIPVEPKDAEGNAIDEVLASDIEWSCVEDGIEISEGGVLTVTDEFAIGANETKDITVNGRINDAEAEKTITVYSYAYYDPITSVSPYSGGFRTISGREAMVWPGSRESKTYTLDSPVAIDAVTNISYSHAWSGSNTAGQTRTMTFKDSAGAVVLQLDYVWAELKYSGDKVGSVTKNEWKEVNITLDPDAGKVTFTCGELVNKRDIDVARLTDIASITLASAANTPDPNDRPLGICNLIINKQ